MVETLGPLPARPPTPPRPGSRIDETPNIENTPIATQIKPQTQTPGDTPQQANSSRAPPSSRASKRVTFSPWLQTEIHSPWTARSADLKDTPNPSSPQTSEIRPFKSILKETGSPIPVWSPNVDKFTTESLDMLLESVTQQLAGESITSRLDAYMQFFGALRTYDGLPAGRDVAEKLGMITGFIQRDVSRDLTNGAPLDTNLANQALKLSAAFVWHNEISAQLSDEFKVFIVEHSITCLQEAKVPKSVLTHYMSILSTQNFGVKILTNARVMRLLSALQDVTNHVTGKAIAVHRLSIYQRLFLQSKTTFVSQASLWIEQLIFGLLHPMKDTRLKAISLGFQIAMTIGPSMTLCKSVRELFDRPLENDRKLVTEIRERMSRMISTVESGVHVPQIWSIIILLLRNKSRSLDQWDHFKEWVLVLQKCFNCSEPAIKAQAIIGWNRFVFAVGPNESTSRSLLKMLGKPVLSQFERKKSDKSGAAPTQLALGSYHNLIYYAFRPSPAYQYLDIIWEEYISVPSSTLFSTSPALSDSASRVLATLLWASQAKVWTETRITDSAKVEPEELPSVDPKWVRSRATSIVKVFEHILKSSVWSEEALEKSNIALAWASFSSALSLASNKEITPSGESTQAIASVLGLLKHLWSIGPSSLNAVGDNKNDIFLERFQLLSTTIISSLGGIYFTEKLLAKNMEDAFQVADTLPQHDSPTGTIPESPILHLLRAVSSGSLFINPTTRYNQLISTIIEAACRSKISRGSRLELLQQCASLANVQMQSASNLPRLPEVVWKGSAGSAAEALRSFPIESSRERDGSVSRDYENVNKILAAGVQFPTAHAEWSSLLASFVRVVRTEKGDRALTTLIVEPIAESLAAATIPETYVPATALLEQSMSIPFMQDSSLGVDAVSQEVASPQFPRSFTELIRKTLQSAYETFSPSQDYRLPSFLESLTSFLGSGIPSSRAQALEALQFPLASWIKDADGKIDWHRGADSRTLTACRALSSAVINVLQTSVPDQLAALQKFEVIICAGLESPHTSRNKKFVDFWCSTASYADPLAPQTPMGQSLAKMTALSASAAEQEKELRNNVLPSHTQEAVVKPQEKRHASRTMGSRSANINSSPLIGLEHRSSVESTESNEPQLPTNAQREAYQQPAMEDVSTINPQANRREMFKMIESIRSSSPANTPSKAACETPVHLRRFRSSNGTGDVPLTPTLAPTETDEGFIGSSPTPATRDPTPAAKKDRPALTIPEVTMADSSDLPSSPPEVSSRSPSPQKRSRSNRSQRRRSAKARQAMLRTATGQFSPKKPKDEAPTPPTLTKPDIQDDPKENTNASEVDERPPSRRTRSALGQSQENEQNSVPPVTLETPGKSKEVVTAQTPKSRSTSKRQRRRDVIRSARRQSQRNEMAADESTLKLVPPEQNVDSSSEEMETQIASQLEQDLVSAVDLGGHVNIVDMVPTTEEQPQTQASKKRKREDEDSQEARSTGAKERRRSTRLTTTKSEDLLDLDCPSPTPSQEPTQESLNAVPSQEVTVKQEMTTSRRSTRNSQRKDEPMPEDTTPATEVSESQVSVQESVQPTPSSKRSRKSLRLEDQPPTPISEEEPKNTKSLRPRRSRSTLTETESQDQQIEAASQPESQSQAVPSQVDSEKSDSQVMVPESIITADKPEIPDVSLVSTEEATDSQMAQTAESTEPATSSFDAQAMDIDVIPEEAPATTNQPMTSVFTSEVQTEPTPILKSEPKTQTTEDIPSTLQRVLDEMKTTTLSPDTLRQVDDLLFNIRVAAHDASRRT